MAWRKKYDAHVNARISTELRETLDRVAERDEVSVGELVRRGLQEVYLADR